MIDKGRKDDAFFYLVRIKCIYNNTTREVLEADQKKRLGDRERAELELVSYLLVTAYVKALELFIEREFYPTF